LCNLQFFCGEQRAKILRGDGPWFFAETNLPCFEGVSDFFGENLDEVALHALLIFLSNNSFY